MLVYCIFCSSSNPPKGPPSRYIIQDAMHVAHPIFVKQPGHPFGRLPYIKMCSTFSKVDASFYPSDLSKYIIQDDMPVANLIIMDIYLLTLSKMLYK